MLEVGDAVPDFSLPLAFADGRRDPVAFRSLLARGPVVIAFYPLAFTRVCTVEMCEIRDAQAAMDELDATVVGFSIDAAPSNAHYARLHEMKNGLYSDANREVVDRIWATQRVVGVDRCAKRGWLVVAQDGTVAAKWVTDNASEWSGLAPVKAALEKLKR